MTDQPTPQRREVALVIAVGATLTAFYAWIYLRYLPNVQNGVGGDYSLWLPDLLVGYFWHLQNGWLALPWFSPAQCGGVPFYADPQVPYLSVPQLLTFIMPPVQAVQLSFLLLAAAGFLGAFYLARIGFRVSCPAALLAGTLFMFNNFYVARMLVGHLTYQPFMLTPALALSAIYNSEATRPRCTWSTATFGGVLVAAMIQGGAIHVLPPALLSVAIMILMRVIRGGSAKPMAVRLTSSVALGGALCGGKLAAGISLIVHFPRDHYNLPGIPGLAATFLRGMQAVFLGPSAHPETIAVNATWTLERHEWEYSVTVVPLVLMLIWLGRKFTHRGPPQRPAQWVILIFLMALPVVLNWYQPGYNAFLKELPFFASSSNLLRWFAVYILPASIAGALALDAVIASPLCPLAGAAAIGCVVGINCLTDRSEYGPGGQATYSVVAIQAAWRAAARAHTGPRITSIGVMMDQRGRVVLPPNRQDAFVFGYSQLLCYEPFFGYRLERFPVGALHTGAALRAEAGVLNVKNPACYVFPRANGCAPGDPFPETRIADAQAFLDYSPFPFDKPLWAHLADSVSLLTAFLVGLAAVSTLRSGILQTASITAVLSARGRQALLWPNAAGTKVASLLRREGVAETNSTEATPVVPLQTRMDGLIEIVLPNGVIIRVDAQVDAIALRKVLAVVQNDLISQQ